MRELRIETGPMPEPGFAASSTGLNSSGVEFRKTFVRSRPWISHWLSVQVNPARGRTMAEQNLEQSIFLHAIGLAEPADRAAYLDEACQHNPGLRAELDALLAAHGRLGDVTPPRLGPGATEAFTLPPEAGTVIGTYKLVEQIGEGGMGTVWMAQQSEPVKRVVAIKLIKAGMDSRQVIARFEAERQALALMDHANIARVLDAG